VVKGEFHKDDAQHPHKRNPFLSIKTCVYFRYSCKNDYPMDASQKASNHEIFKKITELHPPPQIGLHKISSPIFGFRFDTAQNKPPPMSVTTAEVCVLKNFVYLLTSLPFSRFASCFLLQFVVSEDT
jgi:hypothetical protein